MRGGEERGDDETIISEFFREVSHFYFLGACICKFERGDIHIGSNANVGERERTRRKTEPHRVTTLERSVATAA